VPSSRRGEAVGVYGLGVAVPHLLILPASVTIADRLGFVWVFALGALSLLGIPAALLLGVVLHRLAAEEAARGAAEGREGRGALRRSRLSGPVLLRVALPAVVLFVVTVSGGGVMTFLPQAVTSSLLSSWGLFVLGGLAAISRWWIGRIGDRRGNDRLMAPLLALTAVGLVLLGVAVADDAWLWLLLPALAVVGFGYGALQNVTLVSAFAQVTPRHYGSASAVWNIGFDAGTGVGAVMIGLVASVSGFPAGFVVSAVVVAACIPLSLRMVSRRQWARDPV
jgi:predicted MFS family arabinose efflux permease